MLDYKYTNINQLDKPDKYMYSSFQGGEFLEVYSKDRLKYIINLLLTIVNIELTYPLLHFSITITPLI